MKKKESQPLKLVSLNEVLFYLRMIKDEVDMPEAYEDKIDAIEDFICEKLSKGY